ncbi:hypothetical protein V9K67_06095 [Paraflavisolibacter sp. H34]|uniref:hypothetical protein n=1 Tax=Huijunlia imazamoxiresistens TaxID=3127457 RepID=UPI00301B273D
MKTSNKILLGAFLTSLLLLSTMFLAVYARFRSGHFKKTGPDKQLIMQTYPLDNITHIQANNMFVRVETDKKDPYPRLAYPKDEAGKFKIERRGDTLVLTAIEQGEFRQYSDVNLHLSGKTGLTVNRATVYLATSQVHTTDTLEAGSLNLYLDSAQLNFGVLPKHVIRPYRFDTLNIVARNQSSLRLNPVTLKRLDVRLQASELHDEGLSAGAFILEADSSSRALLSGKNLHKIRAAR